MRKRPASTYRMSSLLLTPRYYPASPSPPPRPSLGHPPGSHMPPHTCRSRHSCTAESPRTSCSTSQKFSAPTCKYARAGAAAQSHPPLPSLPPAASACACWAALARLTLVRKVPSGRNTFQVLYSIKSSGSPIAWKTCAIGLAASQNWGRGETALVMLIHGAVG